MPQGKIAVLQTKDQQSPGSHCWEVTTSVRLQGQLLSYTARSHATSLFAGLEMGERLSQAHSGNEELSHRQHCQLSAMFKPGKTHEVRTQGTGEGPETQCRGEEGREAASGQEVGPAGGPVQEFGASPSRQEGSTDACRGICPTSLTFSWKWG